MAEKLTASITAVGGYVPDYRLTNRELETMIETTDEWIKTRTGIEERRILKGAGKATSDLGAPAVLDLCQKRGIDPLEIDCIICCTVTPDMTFPATANVICEKVGAKKRFQFRFRGGLHRFCVWVDGWSIVN
jgi:3-oxoacyl-[acyl-carrier-protein] synthase-3